MSEQKSIWVFIEQTDGHIADVSLELVGKARELADPLGYEVVGLLCGHGVEALAGDVISRGADRVLLADHPELARYRTLPYARVAIAEARRRTPDIFLVGGTPNGRDLAPRVASALRCGLTADCTDLQIGDHYVRREDRTYKDLLYQIRPAFGGNIIATIVNPRMRPQMATVREGVMRMPAADASRTGVVERVTPEFEPGDFALEVLEPPDPPVHRGAEGRHVDRRRRGRRRGHRRLRAPPRAGQRARRRGRRLARRGGRRAGSTASTRSARPGTTVRPRLYIAAGISGAVQHRAGMDQSSQDHRHQHRPGAPDLPGRALPDRRRPGEVRADDDQGPARRAPGWTSPRGVEDMSENFFLDNPDLRFRLEQIDLREVAGAQGERLPDADRLPDAPRDYADAKDDYRIVLEVLGDICGKRVAPRAAEADEEGAHFDDGVVTYAAATQDAIDALRQAELIGAMLPREYGGLNLPGVDLLDDGRDRLAGGGRPDDGLRPAGDRRDRSTSTATRRSRRASCRASPAARSRARWCSPRRTPARTWARSRRGRTLDEATGQWRLQRREAVHHQRLRRRLLVLARSEEGSIGRARPVAVPRRARRDGEDPPASRTRWACAPRRPARSSTTTRRRSLIGKRRFGLMRYAMGMMNGARLAVAAQAARHRRGRLPRGRPVRPRARPVRQADPRAAGGGPHAARDAGRARGDARAARRDRPVGGPVEGATSGGRRGRRRGGRRGSRTRQKQADGHGRDAHADGEVLRHRDGQPGLLPGHAGARRRRATCASSTSSATSATCG